MLIACSFESPYFFYFNDCICVLVVNVKDGPKLVTSRLARKSRFAAKRGNAEEVLSKAASSSSSLVQATADNKPHSVRLINSLHLFISHRTYSYYQNIVVA